MMQLGREGPLAYSSFHVSVDNNNEAPSFSPNPQQRQAENKNIARHDSLEDVWRGRGESERTDGRTNEPREASLARTSERRRRTASKKWERVSDLWRRHANPLARSTNSLPITPSERASERERERECGLVSERITQLHFLRTTQIRVLLHLLWTARQFSSKWWDTEGRMGWECLLSTSNLSIKSNCVYSFPLSLSVSPSLVCVCMSVACLSLGAMVRGTQWRLFKSITL